MTSIKRAISALSACSMMLNVTALNNYVTFAEETDETPSVVVDDIIPEHTTFIEETFETTTTITSISEISTSESSSTTATTITEPVDLSSPDLTIEIPDQWTNSIENWKVETEYGAVIYYKVSEDDLDDWGSYTDSDAFEWNNGENLPEGKFYIKFWAVFINTEREVNDSAESQYYQYDKTKPSGFRIKKDGLVLKNENVITDNLSEITNIYYTKDIPNLETKEKIQQYGTRVDIEKTDNGVNFSILLNRDLQRKNITVYVIDEAGNIQSSLTDNNMTEDIDIPELGEHSIISITYDENSNAVEEKQINRIFGHEMLEEHPLTDYIYVSDVSYIKVNAKDEHFDSLVLSVRIGEEYNDIVFKTEELTSPNKVNFSENTYYISIENLIRKLKLRDSSVLFNEIVIKARDTFQNENDKENNITLNNIYYDSLNSEDCQISLSLSQEVFEKSNSGYDDKELDDEIDAYFYGESNTIDITLNDDVGLANYSVKLYQIDENTNHKTLKTTDTADVSSGDICEGSYIATTIVTDSNVTKKVETTTVTVNYNEPIKEVIPETIEFTSDGVYELEVAVTDLEGNKNFVRKKSIVDTTAPTIDDLVYTEKDNILKYFTFGIYGPTDITLMIKVNDGYRRSGVSPKNVVLYWNEKEYTAHCDGEWLVFDRLEPYGNSVPRIVVADRMGNENTYYFTTNEDVSNVPNAPEEKLVLNSSVIDDETGAMLILESNNPVYTVTPAGSNYKSNLGESGKELYFGKNDADDKEDNNLNFVFTDDEGLDYYKISIIDENGQVVEVRNNNDEIISKKQLERHFDTLSEPTKSAGDMKLLQEPVSINVDDMNTGKYSINVELFDLAGNHSETPNDCSFNYGTFHVDKTAPEIIETQYEVVPSIMKYFTFGIFGNDTVTISVRVEDNENGSGIEKVELFWDNPDKAYTSEKSDSNIYKFTSLDVNNTGTPYIIVTDKMGNTNKYYFSSNEKVHEEAKCVGELIKENSGQSGVVLALENEKPEVKINIPDTYKKYIVNDEAWYGSDIKYNITASDIIENSENTIHSGLNHVSVYENDMDNLKYYEDRFITDEFEYIFNKVQFIDKAEYAYNIEEDGHYSVFASAFDNAGNESQDFEEFNIDKENPQIVLFQFGELPDTEPYFDRETFGYFFMVETEAKVYVNDPEISSGFNHVTLYLSNVDGSYIDTTVYGENLMDDEIGTYASFTIPIGFKGKVAAEVVDNVEHSSGRISADGNIVEDGNIHDSVSSINIEESISNSGTDANGVKLYNGSIPLNITVEDTFSGIATIEWSIANDGESGIITVDSDGNPVNDSEVAIIGDIVHDSNLVTSLKFSLSVDSNTNGNVVYIKLTDRSGNSSSIEKTYSIDTTAPIIQAILSNVTPSNGNYYNSEQQVTIYITERNFNAADVKILINDEEQSFDWNEVSVGEDDTVHELTFLISEDGNYNFSINYADMAGNYGESFYQPLFIIDTTPPKISNNFADFGDIGDESVYFNINDKENTKAVITVTETNFYANDMNVNVFYKSAGKSHTDDEWETYYYSPIWQDEEDVHALIIPFDKDGVYKISIDNPVDRAKNSADFKNGTEEYQRYTAVFETDYTIPEIYSRNGKEYYDVENKNAAEPFMDIYNFDRREEDFPNIIFKDTNIDYIEYELQKYTPVYTENKNIGEIKPFKDKGKLEECIDDKSEKIMYTLSDFDLDGVYSVKITVHDKAGNISKVYDNTYVRMISSEVLAYIENSSSDEKTGWYSFEDENGPISKQPESFTDLSIVIFSKLSENSKILLVDKKDDKPTDTNITSNDESIFDKSMFGVGAYRYTLEGSYFSENYNADDDKNLYLKAENAGKTLTLGEIYIDNTNPICDVPAEHYKNWGYFESSGDYVVTFSVNEVLDIDNTVVCVDNKEIKLSENEDSLFYYNDTDESDIKLTLKLAPGSHTVGLVIYDKAKNSTSIPEVHHLAIGIKGLWQNFGRITITTIFAIVVVIIIIHISNKKSKKIYN